MNKQEIRQARLREWVTANGVPQKEKSYFSQLFSGVASFGEKAARRIERDYAMIGIRSAVHFVFDQGEAGMVKKGVMIMNPWIGAGLLLIALNWNGKVWMVPQFQYPSYFQVREWKGLSAEVLA